MATSEEMIEKANAIANGEGRIQHEFDELMKMSNITKTDSCYEQLKDTFFGGAILAMTMMKAATEGAIYNQGYPDFLAEIAGHMGDMQDRVKAGKAEATKSE